VVEEVCQQLARGLLDDPPYELRWMLGHPQHHKVGWQLMWFSIRAGGSCGSQKGLHNGFTRAVVVHQKWLCGLHMSCSS